jgi:integrase/recombinase XerD
VARSKNFQSTTDFLILENFLEMIAAERSLAKNTILSYKNDLENFLQFSAQNNLSISNISLKDINNYITQHTNAILKPTSISRKISAIRQFFKFLLSENIRKDNPALDIDLPKKEINLPKSLSKEQIDKLLHQAFLDNSFEGIRFYAVLEILYSTGMRISELVGLKYSFLFKYVSKDENMLAFVINGKGNKERIVILNNTAMKALNQYLEVREYFLKGQESDFLFPSFNNKGKVTHITRQRFFQLLKQLAIQSNLDPTIISPHKIRHSFASALLQNGANLRVVQELLGHQDISSTQIYTKVIDEQKRELIFTKHPLAQN